MNSTDGKALFFAFISHKSSDSAVALRLQKFIETYRLPTEIRNKTKSPKYLSPVCSYEVDFSSKPLAEEIDDKLNHSHFLILLCSKSLIKNDPKYVNYEIETFIADKRSQGIAPETRIIPVIIDGEFDSPDNECCPEALKVLGDKRPIGIELNKYKNERDAFLHVISGMLDIDYAVLENRDAKYRRNRKIAISACIAAALSISAFMYDYFVPKKSHYLDFVMRNGTPVGIERLSENQYKKINHYVITRHKHKITSLEYVNSKGNLIDHSSVIPSDRPAKYEFDYDSDGLTKVSFCNKNNVPYFVQQYSGDELMAADLKDPTDMTRSYFIGAGYESEPEVLSSDYNIVTHSNVSRFQFEYSNGFVSGVTFHRDNSGALAEDSSVYGFEYSLDSKGRVVEIYYLDALGERRLNSEGVFCKKYSYDKNNNLVQLKNMDAEGKLVADKNGIYQIDRTVNSDHIVEIVKFLDANGELMFSENHGYALKIFDPKTDIVMLYDADNKLISNKSYCAAKITYDKNGFEESQTFLDKNNKPVVDSDLGYATVFHENDENGNALSVSFFDAKGNPVNNKYGYAKEEIKYNQMGLATENVYYDKDGNKADYRQYGYSIIRKTYDKFGRELTCSYFGADDQPVEISGPNFGYGYHELKTTYHDGTSIKISLEYYDKDKKLVNYKTNATGEMYAKAEMFVQNGVITSATQYDKDGNIWGEIIEQTVDYSPKAEKLETTFTYNADKKLLSKSINTYNLKGVNIKLERTAYDEQERITELMTIFYDDAGKRVKAERISYADNGAIESEFYQEFNKDEKESRNILITPNDSENYKSDREYTYHKNLTVDREKTVFTDINGTVKQEHLRIFTPDKIQTNDEILFYEGGVLKSQIETKYHKNGKAAEIRRVSFSKDGKEEDCTVTTYDENGNKLTFQSITYSEDEKVVGDVVYNSDGSRVQKINVYALDGTLKVSDVTEYDKDGKEM